MDTFIFLFKSGVLANCSNYVIIGFLFKDYNGFHLNRLDPSINLPWKCFYSKMDHHFKHNNRLFIFMVTVLRLSIYTVIDDE